MVALAEALDEETPVLEEYLQTAFVESIIDEVYDVIPIKYYGESDINVGADDISSDPFELSGYEISHAEFGGYRVRLSASGQELLPGANSEYGPGGHDIEAYVTSLEFRAEVTLSVNGTYGTASVFVVPTP